MFGQAKSVGAITKEMVAYTLDIPIEECSTVSQTLHQQSKEVVDIFENGGSLLVCGGARTFGTAVERALHSIVQMHGNMTEQESHAYLLDLVQSGRLLEDLAD